MAEPAAKRRVVNGVDQDRFEESRALLRANPELARFRFHLENRWVDGGHSRSTIRSFFGVGEEREHESPFVLDADEPPLLLGEDRGANPVEHLLNAVTTCVTGAIVYHAAARGVHIEKLHSEVEGEIDLRGFLALDPDVRPGYRRIRMKFMIKADCSDEILQELVQAGQRYSPVFDSITKGVSIDVTGERL